MISISMRLKPFSHVAGRMCLLPQSDKIVQAFPTLLKIWNFKGELIKEVPLDVEGPLKKFTLIQDLEKGCVTIFSEKYHYHILPNLEIVFQKSLSSCPKLLTQETLSLGVHKKQDWESIKKRGDFKEIFPIWFRLGSLLNLPSFPDENKGMFSLLEACKKAIELHRPEKVIPAFEKLFLAGFKEMMIPRLQDDDFQGILPFDSFIDNPTSLYLLQQGAFLIRSLFLSSQDNEIAILPNLPPEFFSGRMVNLRCSSYGEIDLEWTKKTIRRMVFRSHHDGNLFFHFDPSLKSFRVRLSGNEKGITLRCGEPLEIKSASVYLLDQFQK